MSRHRRSPGFRDSYSPNSHTENNTRNISDRPNQRPLRSLCLSNIPPKLTDSNLMKTLDKDFTRFGDFQVSITAFSGERVAYLNFRRPSDALNAIQRMENYEIEARRINMRPIYMTNVNNRRSSPQYRKSRSPISRYRQQLPHNYSPPYDQEKPSRSASPDQNSATRTLFIGNLCSEVDESILRKKFDKFGTVRNVDIKRSTKGQAFGFVRYSNVDMAMRAKHELDGDQINGQSMKIGYGKPYPSQCLCVCGIGPWLSFEELEREVVRLGGVARIEWPRNRGYAYVLFHSQTEATVALEALRGLRIGGERLKVDYGDIGDISQPNASTSGQSNSSKHTHRSPSRPLSIDRARTAHQLTDCLKASWSGKLLLRNNTFGCRFFRLRGDAALIDQYLSRRPSTSTSNSLSITRSTPLSTLGDLRQQINGANKHYCILLASSYVVSTTLIDDAMQPQQPMRLLVDYLRVRGVAGCVMIGEEGDAVLLVAPPCDVVVDWMAEKAPMLTRRTSADEDFVMVLLLHNTTAG